MGTWEDVAAVAYSLQSKGYHTDYRTNTLKFITSTLSQGEVVNIVMAENARFTLSFVQPSSVGTIYGFTLN